MGGGVDFVNESPRSVDLNAYITQQVHIKQGIHTAH